MTKENAIEKYETGKLQSFNDLPDMNELQRLSQLLMNSGAFPDLTNIAMVGLKIMAGRELGVPPIAAMNGVHVMKTKGGGMKVVPGANLLAARIKSSGRYDFTITELNDKQCVMAFEYKRDGQWKSCGIPVVYTFAEADAAGYTRFDGKLKDTWKNPQDMLVAAAIRKGFKRYCADLIIPGMETERWADAERLAGEIVNSEEETNLIPACLETESFDDPEIQDAEIISEEENAELTAIAELDELRESVQQAIEAHTFGDAAEIKKILKGRQIEMETAENLRKLLSEIENG
jgi:hypothetical protein